MTDQQSEPRTATFRAITHLGLIGIEALTADDWIEDRGWDPEAEWDLGATKVAILGGAHTGKVLLVNERAPDGVRLDFRHPPTLGVVLAINELILIDWSV